MAAVDPQRPVTGGTFLDRETERRALRTRIEQGRNILIYGPRRRGKTSLILRVLSRLRDPVPLYADATRMKHPGDLGDRILAALAASRIARARVFWRRLQAQVEGLELETGVGRDGAYLRVRRGAPHPIGLLHALEFLERIAHAEDTRFVLCLDEFQVLMHHDDGLVDALRSIAQHQQRVSYILSGSQPSILAGLNQSKSSPFYQQLTEMRIDGITIRAMRHDAERHLGFALDDDALELIEDATRDNTMRVTQVLAHLNALGKGGKRQAAHDAITACIHENATEYERILSLVRPGPQRRLLIALAEDEPEHVTGADFISRHGLKTGAHVLRAAEALARLEIIDAEHRFLDGLFRRYLIQ